MNFERHIDPKHAMGIGQYVYDNGFGPRNYVCTNCKGVKLIQKQSGGFSPPYYICVDCGETVYAPKWIDL